MLKLIAGALLLLTPATLPAHAGLGGAVINESITRYDAWCQTYGNDCRVIFDGDRMRVNNGEGIHRSQLIKAWRIPNYQDGTMAYYVLYSEGGTRHTAKILFLNYNASERFWGSLQAFAGNSAGPAPVDVNINLN